METKTSVVSQAYNMKVTKECPEKGQHQFYDSRNGRLWKHWIVMANDDKGKYNSKSEDQTKFIVGQTVTYTIEEKTTGMYNETIIKPAKDESRAPGAASTSGSKADTSYGNPRESREISLSMNQENARKAYIAMGKTPVDVPALNAMVTYFHEWAIGIEPLDRGRVVRRCFCIANAIEMKTSFPKMKVDESVPVIESSEHILMVAQKLYEVQILMSA